MPIARRQHWRVGPALIAGVLVGVMAASAAAATWSPVQTVGPPAAESREPGLVFASDGTALISWSVRQAFAQPPVFEGRLAVRQADGALGPVQSIADDLAAPPVRIGDNGVALLRERRTALDPFGEMSRVRLSVSSGRVETPVGAVREDVAAYTALPSDQDGPAIAASRDGEVAVAWVQLRPRSTERYLVRVATGRPGRRFAPARTLATGSVDRSESQPVAVTYGAAGELVIAYGTERRPGRPRRRVVAVVARSPRGTFGRPQVLGPRDGRDSLAVAAGARGRAVVAWGTHDGGEEQSRPWVVRAAVRRGRAFGQAQVLDPGGARFESVPERIALALTDDGRATLAWANTLAGANPVKVATTDGAGRFGASTQLAPDGAVGDIAVSATGATLVTWTSFQGVFGGERDTRVLAALRPAASTVFGPPEPISPPETAGSPETIEPQTPRAAFNPRTGTPVVAWSTSTPRPPPTTPQAPPPAPQAVIQLAERTG